MAFLLQSLRALRAQSGDGDLLPPFIQPAAPQGRADKRRDADAIHASAVVVARRHSAAHGVDGTALTRQTLETRR